MASDGAAVRGDVSQRERAGFLREDVTLKEGDEGWAPKASMATRKKAPPQEVPGDAFDRQRVIPDFDQALVQRQVCLVLGAGGIGQNVGLVLGRLGVREVIFVDYDVYDASNLNRQCLGSVADVGRRKVDVAAEGAARHSVGAATTTVTPVHMDVVAEWAAVVELARRSDVIFNGIDIGGSFDTAVGCLAKELGKPLVVGQSYGWTYTAEYYDGQPGTVGAFDAAAVGALFDADPAGKSTHALPREDAMALWGVDGPVAARCADAAVGDARGFVAGYREAALAALAPGQVGACEDLRFLPPPRGKVPTRFVGSWVVPCMGCAVQMVGQWTNALTGPVERGRTPPTFSDMDIPEGSSQAEGVGRGVAKEIGVWGSGMSAEEVAGLVLPPKQMSSDASTHRYTDALLTREAALRTELFFGSAPAYFIPVLGAVAAAPAVIPDPAPPARQTLPEGVVVPETPAVPLAVADPTPAASGTTAPALFVTPVLKTNPAASKELPTAGGWAPCAGAAHTPTVVLTSGKRSALLQYKAPGGRECWVRLKGCGNGEDGGFTLEPLGDNGEMTPRGCGFRDSVLLELEMCRRVAEKTGLEVANTPMGYFEYALPGDATPGIGKYCGVFETVGDKRAGDHLIAGMVELAALMLPASEPAAAEQGLRAARGLGADDDCLPTDIAAACEMPVGDCSRTALHEIPPPPRPDDPCWNNAVERLHRRLLRAKRGTATPSILLHLARRIGWECGYALKALQDARISWGTFKDALGTHCNAHVNNFVVRPSPGEHLFAVLDFDMAFDEELHRTPSAGGDLGSLDDIFKFERAAGMRQVLAGSDFASTGVAGKAELDPAYAPVQTAIYDTIVAGFDGGVAGAPSPRVAALDDVLWDVIILCLTLTKHKVA
eukprot:TRINITY_DN18017_c0_g1_i1.p1 TRINITY_DN18017_c0_g1~~TRINITY_DN18017_c0_g1_i1.p1  ORF type:complete len:890 (+),score=247.41 TRINITY_DN18017_c0_g1_i1:50-2719(+)